LKYSFTERWLLQAGMPEDQVKARNKQALIRAKRYPVPHRWLYFIVLWLIDWGGPLFILFQFKRARKLSDDLFEIFVKRLKENSISIIQITGVFAVMPLIEVLTEEIPPKRREEHPLKKYNLTSITTGSYHSDVIIIGSGAGGAPAALELSRQGMQVTLIEKGDIIKLESAPRMLENYYVGQGLTLSLTGGTILVLAGSTVGGTTSINSGTCLRPLKECLSIWDDQLNTKFADGELDSYLQQAETQIGVTVPPRSLLSKSAELFETGLNELGRSGAYVLPRNAPACEGSGRCCFGCPTGAKQSTDYSFLPQAVKAGTKLLINTEATRIVEKSDAVSVKLEGPDGKKTIYCKHLIIAGGALYTPGILRRNHLGSKLMQVGKHLKIHPATKVFAYFPDHYHGEKGVPQGLGYLPPELPRITLEGIHTPKSMMGPIFSVGGKKFNWWLDHAEHLASFGLMLRDRNKGSLFEVNSFPWINYKLHPDDAKDIGAGILLIAKAFFAAGAERVLLPLTGKNKKEFCGPDELDDFKPEHLGTKDMIISGFHPQGTAGMGRVVDTDLKLMGSKRIFVCDASVFPDSPGVNPQTTIMALSLRLADKLINNP